MNKSSMMPRMRRVFTVALLAILINSQAFAQSVLFRDDFNGTMQSGWTWVRENPATWSLTSTGLRIESEYGDLWQGWTNNCRNMLLRPAPSADFVIEAKLDVSLVAPINQAHILLYYNDDYYVRFGPVLSYGYQIVIDVVHEVGGGIAHQSGASWGSNLVYLKIQKSGSTANCYYSGDGVNWTLHHTISNLNFSIGQVGLVAFDGSEPPSASVATYDYFEVRDASQPPPVCVTPPSGLVSWWPGEDNANDIQNSNHGTLQNGATFAAGKVGQAFSFDGVDEFVEIPHSMSLNPTNALSLEAWIHINQYTFIPAVVSKGNGGNYFESYSLTVTDDGSLQFVLNRDGTSSGRTNVLGPVVPLNTWAHVAGTYDGTTMRLFLNGTEVGSANHAGGIFITPHPVVIGKNDRDPNPFGYPTSYFNGLIDDVAIFNRALSASEIQSLYNASSAGKCKCEVTFNPTGPFCVNAAAVDLSNLVSPIGGTFTGAGISGTMFDPATAGAGTHTITYTRTDANNCVISASQDLVVNALPVASAGDDQILNAGQSVQLGGNPTATGGSGSYTISWSPSEGLDDPTAANPTASPTSTTTYTVTVTDNATGCEATDEVTVQVNQIEPVKPFVFLANKITLKRTKQSTPSGDMHANGVITIEKGDPSVYNSNLTATGNIVIQKSNTINGNVKSPTAITNQGTITGTKTIAPVDNEPLPSKSFSAGGANHTVPKNSVLSLAPGSYGIVTLNSFSTLKLTSGDYFLNELRYSSSVSSAVIEIDLSSRNPVTINVVSNLQLGNEVEIRLLPNGESDSKLVTFFTLQNSAMKLGREAYLLGSFNAPNALVTLEKNSQLRGAICAKELLVERDCLFLHHDAPGSLPGPGNLPKLVDDDEEVSNEQLSVISYQLEQNYPNPFNPSTKITFALPEASVVNLQIFNEAGQLVRQLASGNFAGGRYELHWDGRNQNGKQVAAGVYLYRLTARGQSGEAVFSETRRMTLVK